MSSPYIEDPQRYDAAPTLSLSQKASAFDQMQHLLTTLTMAETPHMSDLSTNPPQWHNTAPSAVHDRSPHTPSKPSPQLNTHRCAELSTSGAAQSPRIPHSTPSNRGLWTRDPNEPPDPLMWDELARMASVKTAMRDSALALVHARRVVEVETQRLYWLDAECAAVQCGWQGKGKGGSYSRTHDRSGSHADSSTTAGQAAEDGSAGVPAFMAQYLPWPDATLFPLVNPPGTKRCTVGRPLGKVLRPSDGRFYTIGRCDKHEDEKVFNDNMHVHESREGGYKEREHAWKCSGEATRGPKRGASRAV